MEEKIEELEEFRDRYLAENPSSTSACRNKLVREQCIRLLEDVCLPNERISKANYNLLCGRIWNIIPEYETSCEEYLSKAVKLDPTSVESWNELGECLWKKNDTAGAKNCFKIALEKSRNPASLRNLAIMMRQQPSTSVKERNELIKASLDYAKEASERGSQDRQNYYSLGNAYLSYFFACGQQNPSFIEKSLEAYEKAKELSEGSYLSADLHFNYGQGLLFEQRYSEALSALREAARLDPEFTEASLKERNLAKYLTGCHEAVLKKAKMRPKRLDQILKVLDSSKDLGPYADGKFTNKSGKSVELRETSLDDLSESNNFNKVVVGKVIGFVTNEESIPYTFILSDSSSSCCAATVYNFSPKFGLVIGNSVAIPEPFVIDVNFAFDDVAVKYRAIRIPNPKVLAVNGKRLSEESAAMVEVSLSS